MTDTQFFIEIIFGIEVGKTLVYPLLNIILFGIKVENDVILTVPSQLFTLIHLVLPIELKHPMESRF